MSRCALAANRVTLLMAPAGFGKTTLMAACCREARARGVATAWLSLATEDRASNLDTYLAQAFKASGLDFDEAIRPDATAEPRYPRTRDTLCRLEGSDRSWVLVLDELECLTDRESVALVSFLLHGAPSNLHLALSCRQLPGGLDAVVAVFGDDATMLGADDLLFSPADVARFFALKLSRTELAEVMAETAGWPIALRVAGGRLSLSGVASSGSAPDNGPAVNAVVALEVVMNWVEGRFIRGFSDVDRELLVYLGLFDWFDGDLVDDIFEQSDTFAWLMHTPKLTGLILPVDNGYRGAYQLHPLLRHYSETRRRKAPAGYRDFQRRIGLAMARRGDTVGGMRQAVAAADAPLAGRILRDAGGLGFWLRNGTDHLLAANQLLTDRTVAKDARLAMVRCIAQAVVGDLVGARRTFAAAETALTATSVTDNDATLDVDLCLVRAVLARNGDQMVGAASVRALMADVQRLADLPTVDPVVRGTMEAGLCLYDGLRAQFGAALDHGRRARALVTGRSAYLVVAVDYTCGQISMAQGNVPEALRQYRTGHRSANRRFDGHPRLAAIGAVLKSEVDRERNFTSGEVRMPALSKVLLRTGTDFGCHAAASDFAIERARDTGGPDAALAVLDDIWEHARRIGLPALERYLPAVRVSLLADVGRIDEASNTWFAAGLPMDDADCLDLAGQSWREMESLCCARLRLRIACGEHDTARRFGHALADAAAARGMLRTRLRGIALLVAMEIGAGNREEAIRLVEAYLRLSSTSDYVRPLVRAGAAAEVALAGYLEEHPDGLLADMAERLTNAIGGGMSEMPVFRGKQREVLDRLGEQRDKDIAVAVDLSIDGVRYHVRTIFKKLGVRGRQAAVRRARQLGILSST